MKPDGGPCQYMAVPGMTLRQWYAGMALQGILSRENIRIKNPDDMVGAVVRDSFLFADAMIEEGKKE